MTKPQDTQYARLSSNLLNQPYLLVVLAPLFWGGNMVAGKLAVDQVDPYTLTVMRWLGALLMTLPFAWGPLQRDWPAIRKAWPILLLYGALGYTTFNMFMYLAAHFTSAINTSIEQALIPVLVMIANFIIFRVRARALQVLGVVITIVGIAITASHGDFGRILSLTINIGDGFVVLACIAYAAYSLALRYRPAGPPARSVAGWSAKAGRKASSASLAALMSRKRRQHMTSAAASSAESGAAWATMRRRRIAWGAPTCSSIWAATRTASRSPGTAASAMSSASLALGASRWSRNSFAWRSARCCFQCL